ncbi:hypothetical protein L5M36_19595 [Shewanella sp. SM72]|uniref:hypothetical protein n=1 Tax=Shewanella TaxID=22 RepID=UPI0021D93799|nr:hypothetical protein [Shewanella sp. SM72]MCU8019069.1 hypothetical protein [Shewanella sp. SM72]
MKTHQQISLDDISAQLKFIKNSDDLRSVNELLTRSMATQKIQGLLKDDNLVLICNAVIELALADKDNKQENRLISAAILGRISAVVRSRKEIVFERLGELFHGEPGSIDLLADGDEKYYASIAFASVKAPWLVKYCLQEAVSVDTAEKARRIFIATALGEIGNLSSFWHEFSSAFEALKLMEGNEARYKRIRRISSSTLEVVQEWSSKVGTNPGTALGEWLFKLMLTNNREVGEDVLTDIIDDSLLMLARIIELRFSYALLAPTYAMLEKARTVLGRDAWVEIMRQSKNLERIRTCLKEAALVVARQGKTDSDLVEMLVSAYYSRSQAMPAIVSHFTEAQELDPEVKAWWEQAGNVQNRIREAVHKIGNSEDQQIGSLLINVEDSKTVMEKLERAVVPFVEISDPALAATVKKAASSYAEIALVARQLATMRKLKHMGLKGAVLEYNPLQHELLGGHQMGIRTVRVERDGIQKDFGRKIKVLVKPRVSKEE